MHILYYSALSNFETFNLVFNKKRRKTYDRYYNSFCNTHCGAY